MPTIDQTTGECLVYSYKEGLLSGLAHDLKLRVTRFLVELSDGKQGLQLVASFDARSVQLVCEMRGGVEHPGSLSESDRAKIERNAQEDVLRATEHPEVRFRSTSIIREGAGYRATGTLTLCGVSKELTVLSHPGEGGLQVAELTLHQPDFGIKPFSAMLGALKVKPDVTIRISLPA